MVEPIRVANGRSKILILESSSKVGRFAWTFFVNAIIVKNSRTAIKLQRLLHGTRGSMALGKVFGLQPVPAANIKTNTI